MNIIRKIKQAYLDWWVLTSTGEKFGALMVAIIIIITILALMFVDN